MKKLCSILLVTMLIATALLTVGCSKKEYVLDDEALVYTLIDDNYRTFYEIFVGGFSDSNGDGIGDINGLISRLDYLNDGDPSSGKSLGVTGLWLMPVTPSLTYHKYDVYDYKMIDERYGTMDDMRNLVSECHKRGVSVVIDMVLNHTSYQHKWYKACQSAISKGDFDNKYASYYTIGTTPQPDWYYLATDPSGTKCYYEGNFSSEMPELNWDNRDVREEIVSIADFWLKDVGIDGFRLDAVKYFYYGDDAKNVQALKWFSDECKKIKSDVYLVAENWSDQSSVLNYYQSVNCFDFVFSELSGYVISSAKFATASIFTTAVQNYYNATKKANPDAIMAPFISNHDMDRVGGYLNTNDYSYQLSAAMYLLLPGNPYIYYGEEIGMCGNRAPGVSTDADRRLAMRWGDDDTVANPVGATYPEASQKNDTVAKQRSDKNSLYNHYKKAIALRQSNPEIARGSVEAVKIVGYDNLAILKYIYNGSTVYVLHNLSSAEYDVDVSSFGVTTLRGWLTNKATLSGNTLQLGAFSSVVLK